MIQVIWCWALTVEYGFSLSKIHVTFDVHEVTLEGSFLRVSSVTINSTTTPY